MIQFQYYEEKYFYEIEKMIIQSYEYDYPIWGLSRHEFTKAIHPDFKDCHQVWTESMGVYLENGQVVAAVLSEGSYEGDAFFFFDSKARTSDLELLKRMVRFAIKHLSSVDDDRITRTLQIQIPDWNTNLRDVVLSFGFVDTLEKEDINILPFNEKPFEVVLPEGFHFSEEPVPAFYLSNVHRISFSYGTPHAEKGSKAFETLRHMKHYDPSLEVVLLDEENQPVGFAIGWMDPLLPYAELEPMAICWWCRRKGLGKALIYELSNRIKAKYPHAKGMTGGTQAFYKSIGFETVTSVPSYQYKKVIHRSWDIKSKDEKYDI